MKKFFILIISVLLLLSGCGKETVKETEETEDKIRIGMCCDSFVLERWEKDRDVFVSTARDLGAEVDVQNANGDVQEQIEEINYFIDSKVDAIVIISIDADALSDVVKKAKNAGIKVIAYDRMINNAGADLYISFDNRKVGNIMGETLVNAGLPDKKVIMLQGPLTDDNVGEIEEGFMEICSREGIEVIGSMNAEGWKAEEATDYLYENEDLLEEADGIMCGNDNIATAVERVLAEKRKAGEIALVGQDADLEACQRIVEGTQTGTVYKPVEKEAEAAARTTISLIKGESVEGLLDRSDGKYNVPSIILEPIAVDRDNIDEVIIDSGFHLEDEVYLNVRK